MHIIIFTEIPSLELMTSYLLPDSCDVLSFSLDSALLYHYESRHVEVINLTGFPPSYTSQLNITSPFSREMYMMDDKIYSRSEDHVPTTIVDVRTGQTKRVTGQYGKLIGTLPPGLLVYTRVVCVFIRFGN